MEELHPLVRAILRGLLEGPLYALTEDVIARLSSDEDGTPEGGRADEMPERRDRSIYTSPRKPTDDDGMSQLVVVEEVVGGWLSREIAIAEALPKLARSLDLDRVSFDRLGDINLAGDDRSLALEAFQKRFLLVVTRARAVLAGDAGGPQ